MNLNLDSDGARDSQVSLLKDFSSEAGTIEPGPALYQRSWYPRRVHLLHLAVLHFLVIGLVASIFLRESPLIGCVDPLQSIYSPANTAVEYVTMVAEENFRSKGPYMGSPEDGLPTDETDALWEELFDAGISAITAAEATGLPNRTVEIPGEPGRYVIQLEVFHQLHCLNSLRKIFFPARYGTGGEFGDYTRADGTRDYKSITAKHYDHCIDAIRRSLMCHGDIAVGFWRWDDFRQKPIPSTGVVHVCKDYRKIQQWAFDHKVQDISSVLNYPLGPEENVHLSPL